MPDLPNIFELLIAAGFTATGGWLLVRGILRLLFKNPELSWTKVSGKVTLSGVDDVENSDGDKSYRITLEYIYEYHGIRYIGERLAPLQFRPGFRWTAESITRRYPPGREVSVYVNPDNPGKSVLEPGRQVIPALACALMGVVCCLFAFVAVYSR